MRISLAVAIVIYHTVPTSDGEYWDMRYWTGPFNGLISTMLPMFFALSGFLVAGSLERTPKLSQFLTLRAIRLVPALAIEILLCALILGPLVTTYPLQQYFTDPEFWAYFRNVIGDVHFELPGVFEYLPFTDVVNASLWTVPLELKAYGLLSILMILGLTKRRWLLLAVLMTICILVPVHRFATDDVGSYGPMRAWPLITCFFCGMLVYSFRDKLVYNIWLGAAAAIAAVVCFHFYQSQFWGAPLIAYATTVFGLIKMPRIPVISSGDYSYGLYLFAFPIQQTFAHYFPDAREWYWNAAFALTLGLAYAALSWHFIENPVLKRKKAILAWVDQVDTRVKDFLRPILTSIRTFLSGHSSAKARSAAPDAA